MDLDLRPTDSGTDLDVHYRITNSTVDSADFIAGIEIGFGQSLDKLAATLAADPHRTDVTHDTGITHITRVADDSDGTDTDTRSTK